MKIVINGTEPQFKVYKMTESIENKFYIGKTKNPLQDRMKGHRHGDHGDKSADTHFANVGWNNVTVDIIDTANSEEELRKKGEEQIIKNRSDKMLNKHFNNNKSNSNQNNQPKNIETVEKCVRFWSEDSHAWITRTVQIQIEKLTKTITN